MSLSRATDAHGHPIPLAGRPPYRADDLGPLVDVPFDLPADDPFVAGTGDDEHAYLDAAREGWHDFPDWMDFLDMDSPAWGLKRAARDLYLDVWEPWLGPAQRVMDVGCGIGRFVHPMLDRGATVWGVDGDLTALQRCAWRAPGRAGKLELHWSSVHKLPDVRDLDAIISCEVLCYVPDVEPVLAAIHDRLRPGGAFLVGWEARYGWIGAADAAPVIDPATMFGETEIVDIPGDRWVRTLDGEGLTKLLEGAGLRVERMVPTHYIPDGPVERAAPDDLTREQLLALEARLRAHPIFGPLNRMWTAVAIRP